MLNILIIGTVYAMYPTTQIQPAVQAAPQPQASPGTKKMDCEETGQVTGPILQPSQITPSILATTTQAAAAIATIPSSPAGYLPDLNTISSSAFATATASSSSDKPLAYSVSWLLAFSLFL